MAYFNTISLSTNFISLKKKRQSDWDAKLKRDSDEFNHKRDSIEQHKKDSIFIIQYAKYIYKKDSILNSTPLIITGLKFPTSGYSITFLSQ